MLTAGSGKSRRYASASAYEQPRARAHSWPALLLLSLLVQLAGSGSQRSRLVPFEARAIAWPEAQETHIVVLQHTSTESGTAAQ